MMAKKVNPIIGLVTCSSELKRFINCWKKNY